jgi:hypothetical protein
MDKRGLSAGAHLLRVSTLGINFALSPFVGAGLGWAAHHWLGAGKGAILAGFFLGLLAGSWLLVKALRGLGREEKRGEGP